MWGFFFSSFELWATFCAKASFNWPVLRCLLSALEQASRLQADICWRTSSDWWGEKYKKKSKNKTLHLNSDLRETLSSLLHLPPAGPHPHHHPTSLPSILPSRLNRSKLICKILIWGARGWGRRGWGRGRHDCGRILIRTGRSSSLLYTLRSSYLHNWLMFLCEVGMNNTLVGLLHPQADEKMFNFSKCSAPAPLFSPFHFPLPGYLWVLACVCEFSLASPRLEQRCWFASFRVYCRLEVHVKHHKQKAASAFANTRRINWRNELSVVPLTDTARAVSLYKLFAFGKKKKRKKRNHAFGHFFF